MGIIYDCVTRFMGFQTVDLRLARQLYSIDGKRVSLSAEVFNLFNWYNKLSYGGMHFTATDTPVAPFGAAGTGAGNRVWCGERDWVW